MSTLDYEAYNKCFAGVYKKHAKESGMHVFSCYVRNAVCHYITSDLDGRERLTGRAGTEDATGVRIARALLKQGFRACDILAFTARQQRSVNNAEETSGGGDFTDMLDDLYGEAVEYHGWGKRDNFLRWVWITNGAPDIDTSRYQPVKVERQIEAEYDAPCTCSGCQVVPSEPEPDPTTSPYFSYLPRAGQTTAYYGAPFPQEEVPAYYSAPFPVE